jgi:hypothetical protein
MKRIALLACLMLAACTDPRLNAGLSLGANGLSVTPSLSGSIGDGARVSISP